MAARTPQGKWVIYNAKTGARIERWAVDAREMLATGDYVEQDPKAKPKAEPKAGSAAEHPLHEVALSRIGEALAEIDDPEVITKARDSDPRSTSAPHYDARLQEIAAAAEHSPGVPLEAGGVKEGEGGSA